MRMKLITTFLLFLTLVNAKGLQKVSLQLQWLNQFQFAGYYMAKEKGFYKDLGLDVDIKEFHTGIKPINEIINKNSTYSIGRSSLIIDKSKDKKIVLLASIFQSSPLVMLALKESNIKSINDFAGKRAMITSDLATTASLQAMWQKNGLNINDIIQMNHSFDLDDLINKKTDLMVSYLSNETFLLKEKGIEYNIFDPKDYGFDFYSDILFTSEDEITNNKQRALNFTKASIMGWEYAFDHIEESVDLIYSKYNAQDKSKEALYFEAETLKKLAYYKTDKLGDIDGHKIQRIYDIYNILGLVKKRIDIEKFVLCGKNPIVLDLSEKEKSWIKEHPIVTYSEVDWKPLSIIANENMKGIMGDFLDLVSSRTGIHFKFVPSTSWTNVLEQFKEKKIDIVPGIGSSSEEKALGLISDRYAKYPMAIVTGKKYKFIENLEELNGKTIALAHHSSYDFLVKNYPKIKLITTQNAPQALMSVEKGEADAFVGHIATSLFYISQFHLSDLKISGITSFEFEHHYLVQQQSPELLSIINKAFKSITESDRSNIYSNWVNTTVEQKIDYTLAFKILVGLFIFLLFLLHRETTFSKYTQALEVTQEQFALGQKIANIGVWNFDYRTNNLEWTDGIHHIFGTNSKTFEVTLESFMDFVHPDDRDKIIRAYSDSIAEKRDYFVEHRIILEDGTIKYVQERCQNFFDDEDNILNSIGTVLDISIQKGLEGEILRINKSLEEKVVQRTEEQNVLLSLFDKGESILFKWNNDSSLSVDYVSESINKVLGYKKSDFLNNTITYAECIHKDDLSLVVKELEKAIEQNREYFEHDPYRVYTKEGGVKWVHNSTIIVKDSNHNIVNFVGYITDITDIKEKDKQLLQQSRMAQMGEMISMIAHQWRQPLGAISSTSIDMSLKLRLEEFDLEQEQEREKCFVYFINSLENIDEFVQNLTNTIDDFRNFYKPNKNSINTLMKEPITKALNIVRASFLSDGIELVEQYACVNRVTIHENELMQVILNILKNSQDNFKEKNIENAKILIQTYDIGDCIRIEISDNGGGIDEDIVQKIFDPYFSTKSEKNGTGLGLYMSKTIIETHHNGKIYAKNRDAGVCFFIDMPNEENIVIESVAKREAVTV